MAELKKTSLMKAIERAHEGKDLGDIVIEAVNATGSRAGAARQLGVADKTLEGWLDDLGIVIETGVQARRVGSSSHPAGQAPLPT